jgi:hypothetical protein
VSFGQALPGAALTGVTTGIAAASVLGGPAGIAIGIGSALFGLF